MKKYVCPICGYVHEGNEPPKSALSAAPPVPSSRSRAQKALFMPMSTE